MNHPVRLCSESALVSRRTRIAPGDDAPLDSAFRHSWGRGVSTRYLLRLSWFPKLRVAGTGPAALARETGFAFPLLVTISAGGVSVGPVVRKGGADGGVRQVESGLLRLGRGSGLHRIFEGVMAACPEHLSPIAGTWEEPRRDLEGRKEPGWKARTVVVAILGLSRNRGRLTAGRPWTRT